MSFCLMLSSLWLFLRLRFLISRFSSPYSYYKRVYAYIPVSTTYPWPLVTSSFESTWGYVPTTSFCKSWQRGCRLLQGPLYCTHNIQSIFIMPLGTFCNNIFDKKTVICLCDAKSLATCQSWPDAWFFHGLTLSWRDVQGKFQVSLSLSIP